MKPLSGLYYIKENKGKSAIIIFLFFFTTLLFVAGNYVSSNLYYWEKAQDYSDKNCVVSAISNDEDYKDYKAFREKLLKDDNLLVLDRSARGFSGMSWVCTMGFEMGGSSMVFETKQDMEKAFDELGIKADLSEVGDGSVCMSSEFAKQYGLKKGDVLDASVYKNIGGKYTVDAILDDDSFVLFYVKKSGEPLRMNVIGKDISGHELRDYLNDLKGEYKVQIDEPIRDEIAAEFAPFELIFGVGIVLLSVILAVIVNSVITGQFIARTYEFGVYRAIGLSRMDIYKKCAREILCMDAVAVTLGAAVLYLMMFIGNELYYKPSGRYLPYWSKTGILAFVASNLLVLVPTVLLKGRKMSRADVTQF